MKINWSGIEFKMMTIGACYLLGGNTAAGAAMAIFACISLIGVMT